MDKNYLEWPNEELGRLVKQLQSEFENTDIESDAIPGTAAIYFLVNLCVKANAAELILDLTGITIKDKCSGDWKLELRRTNAEIDDTCDSFSITERKLDLN